MKGGASMEIDPTTRCVELATQFTVGDYLDAVAHDPPNQEKIAEGIHRRFLERYLEPVFSSPRRHGFTMMAVACLMIEALESFRQGWRDTKGRGASELAFHSFFDAHESFALFRGHVRDFYEGVRCGILHQAETTLGWRIRRDGSLLKINGPIRTVNADKFVAALTNELDHYRDQLKASPWDDDLWQSLRHKMDRVCANCTSKSKNKWGVGRIDLKGITHEGRNSRMGLAALGSAPRIRRTSRGLAVRWANVEAGVFPHLMYEK